MKTSGLAAAGMIIALPSTAIASQRLVVQAIQIGSETVRYKQGVPTLDLWTQTGGVQITPMPMSEGRVNFVVAVFNNLDRPVNFGAENIQAQNANASVRILTLEDAIRHAEKKAFWTKFGLALVGGLAAGAAASQRNTYYGSASTPYGSYHFQGSYPSLAGQLQANQISRDTGFALAGVQYRLDQTRERLANNLVQLNTIDPGDTYGGRIILGKLKSDNLSQEVRVTVTWNGSTYPFAFRVVKAGTPTPTFDSITPAGLPGFVTTAAQRRGPAALAGAPDVKPEDVKDLGRGVFLYRAKTASGWCIVAPSGYRGTNAPNAPAVTDGLPPCSKLTSVGH